MRKGFSLVELSIVLIVMGLLLAGGLEIAAIQIESAKAKQTRDKLNKIERALQLHYTTTGALPCPANGAAATNAVTHGLGSVSNSGNLADATCPNVSATISTNTYLGVVPTRELDLPDDFMLDGWKNRITYVVSKYCVDPQNWLPLSAATATTYTSDPATTSPHGCIAMSGAYPAAIGASPPAGGNIQIRDNTGDSIRTSNAVYLFISHGKNGLGSWNYAGNRKTTASPSSTYDLDNASLTSATSGANAFDLSFRDDAILDAPGSAAYFDDLVKWSTGRTLQHEAEQ
ncbi:type II secretion system protein [Phragmitibacter flavus]|uniref:Type II secretion system protein n=1 Tax=Phragmitibacter flavus TaxID=2576071 RepID=A0A5R8KGQ0_9BACT|nr:type II secretion system protein [Phragmitibacter flavus]TLD71472.1 type II secretion system protein [Phragmitibacter flavus]